MSYVGSPTGAPRQNRTSLVTTHRPYGDISDIAGMTRVLEACASPDSAYLHAGDLQWRAFGPHGFPLSALIEVWEEDGALVGFALLESGSGFSAQVLPDSRGSALEREILGWARKRILAWRESQHLEALCEVDVYAGDDARIDLLQETGYHLTSAGYVGFRRDLDDIESVALPGGWQARAIEEPDVDSRATCQFEAFAPGSRTTPATWRAMRESAPGYIANLDTVVVSPEGVVVSAAMAWLDTANKVGLFEPVGTRPAFQGNGYGRAALLRGLQAMRDHGMMSAIVSTNATNHRAIATYQSVGFRIGTQGSVWEWRPS